MTDRNQDFKAPEPRADNQSSATRVEDLLPCPFCGWDEPQLQPARISSEDHELIESQFVQCLECGTIGPPDDDGDDLHVIKLWNRRAIPAASPQREADLTSKITAILDYCDNAPGNCPEDGHENMSNAIDEIRGLLAAKEPQTEADVLLTWVDKLSQPLQVILSEAGNIGAEPTAADEVERSAVSIARSAWRAAAILEEMRAAAKEPR